METRYLLGMRVDGTSVQDAVLRILTWAREERSTYVCVANVHMVMESHDALDFRKLVNDAGLVTPDGMPVVWGMQMLGVERQARVYGPDLTLHVCEAAARAGVPIGLYGGTEESLSSFTCELEKRFPSLVVAARIAPAFRPLTSEEDDSHTRKLADSGARIILVGIGCPKQERWMAAHRGRIPAVMIGVGAAFDFHSGRVKQAPSWMQRIGLEWFFRLLMEPKRLWKRYLKHNPRFLALFLLQMLGFRSFREV